MFVQINFPKNIIIADFTYLVIDLTPSIKEINFKNFPILSLSLFYHAKNQQGEI